MDRPLALLDLDGTLTDSAPGITASVRHAYTALGLSVPDEATLRSFVGPPIQTGMLAHGVPADRLDEAVAAYRELYAGGALFDNRVYDGIPEALRTLRHAGVRLAVATSKPEPFARRIADRFGLDELVDGVYGASLDESRLSKAAVVGYALAALGIGPDAGHLGLALMVGDRRHDVEGARAHGLPCLGVAWGYARPGELASAGAVAVVTTPADLPAAVLGQLRPVG